MNRPPQGNSSMPNNDSSANNPQEPDNYFSLIPIEERRKIWDRLCRPVDKPRRATATVFTAFDRDFFAHVEPKLDGFVRLYGELVHLGFWSFSEAWSGVMVEARRLGASHLSNDAFQALDDWIAQAVLAAIDVFDSAKEGRR